MPVLLPSWFRHGPTDGRAVWDTLTSISDLRLNTICVSGNCPNRGECFSNRTATFMILGETCTRGCGFCNVKSGRPSPPAEDEPARVAEGVARLGLQHAVITSVTRDDLADGGAAHFAATVQAIRHRSPGTRVEVLTPDFRGVPDALDIVLGSGIRIFNHNVEMAARLSPSIRPGADHGRSLQLLRDAKSRRPDIMVKSGFMVGLGEDDAEQEAVVRELREAGCDIVTIGQYLRPGRDKVPVVRYVLPERFEELARLGRGMGIPFVISGPLVRSSYRAGEVSIKLKV